MNNLDISDEEKIYHDWIAQNLSYVAGHKSCIEVMKIVFMQGFSAGYMYKKQYSAKEQLQK